MTGQGIDYSTDSVLIEIRAQIAADGGVLINAGAFGSEYANLDAGGTNNDLLNFYWDGGSLHRADLNNPDTTGFNHLAFVYTSNGGASTLDTYVNGVLTASAAPGTAAVAGELDVSYLLQAPQLNRGAAADVDAFAISTFTGSFTTDDFVIPEPASLALLGLGGLMMIRRRRA